MESVAAEKGVNFHGIKKASGGNDETIFDRQFIRSKTKTDIISLGADLFAGTAWTFASPHFDDQLHYPCWNSYWAIIPPFRMNAVFSLVRHPVCARVSVSLYLMPFMMAA